MAARGYCELSEVVEQTLASWGDESFQKEAMYASSGLENARRWFENPPDYERHGERLKTEGVYPEVVRFSAHVAPILHALGQLPEAA